MKRLRSRSGLSGRELGKRIGISQSKVSRIESAVSLPTVPEVEAWGTAVGVTPEGVRGLVELVDRAFREGRSWHTALAGRAHLQDEIRQREVAATRVATYQPSVVPGLLQTADYARRVFSLPSAHYDDEALAAAIAARMDRQLAIYRGGKRFDFLITEAALRWRPGRQEDLRAQWHRLASISTLDNVSLGVIPHDQEAVTTYSHSFVIYDDEEGGFVTVEMVHGPLVLEDDADVVAYRERWSLLCRMALFGDRARDYLATRVGQAVPAPSAD
ncbi:helix-turn-helix transcriptional regulator [Actinokineospora auranticolor]|uniref:Helix-turn-helix protein n=1 Tax=Actinokineospora auranticolor TaxID=155976 RepID=A0A2S6H140_9PSEU|nr:helix-turn-helix transcriptional regulator [Actinokineospora auranticolor]PPK71151.1 helix-turn-helix protein [Actinokineospora auranticolor]